MKKVLKIIGIILLVIIVIGIILLKLLASRPAAPKNYQSTVQTGGDIEKKYMANGTYEVSILENAVLQEFGKFIVYYPKELENENKKYPVIVLCNGSGTPMSKYSSVAKHLASWGFIVIGTEENYSWNAFGAEISIRYLERFNENETIENTKSVFYQKVDFDNVGVVGHSQGGVGVINALTDTTHKDIYKAAVSLSPTNKELAHNLFWDYDATLIKAPIMLISGEGGGDDWVVTLDQLKAIYDDISSSKIMVRRKNTAHNEVLYSANGYVVAWFMYYLQNDKDAGRFFMGIDPEILNNNLYQDEQINILE